MFNNILGIITTPETNINLGELTQKRSIETVGLASRYRVIDFSLSNFMHAGIDDVVFCAKTPTPSLLRHLRNGKPWNMSRKRGGLRLDFCNNGGENAVNSELHQLYRLTQDDTIFKGKTYVIINTRLQNIYAADYKKLVDAAKSESVDFVGCYTLVSSEKESYTGLPTLTTDENNTIQYFSQLASTTKEAVALDLGVYVMRTGFFKKIIADAITHTNATTFLEAMQLSNESSNGIAKQHKGYVGVIRDVQTYFSVQKDMVKKEVQEDLFYRFHQMATQSSDEAPTYYNAKAKVKNTLLATGCRISGNVENSVIARRVTIGKNTKIENCIIMNQVEIGDNVRLKNVILDKEAIIRDNVELSGTEKIPFVIPEKSKV